jgi:hypothetical protein
MIKFVPRPKPEENKPPGWDEDEDELEGKTEDRSVPKKPTANT